MKLQYNSIMKKLNSGEVDSFWSLPAQDRELIMRYQERQRRNAGYPSSGRSESIMRNRVLRAQSMRRPHNGLY